MATAPLFTDKEAHFLETLVEEGVEFLVVGLAAAALQGAPAVTQDIDLWFRNPSDPALQSAGGHAGLFDIVVHMHGLGSFAQEARRARRIPLGRVEVRVLPLARIIASKKATDRPEDRAILPVLEDALRVLQSRKRPAAR